MAKKKKSDVNRTQAIKDYLAQNPDAMPKAAAEELQKQGVDVNAQHISTVKHTLKKETGTATAQQAPKKRASKKKGRRKKKVAAKKKAAPKKKADDDKISLSALKEAKKLATTLGGIEEAKQAISALAQLTD